MIIKNIHIDRFGGLSGRDFALDAGVNLLFGANESGKSSLAGFVKFMFYGLPVREKAANPEKTRGLEQKSGAASGWMRVISSSGESFLLERSASDVSRERIRIVSEKTGAVIEGVNPGEYFFHTTADLYASTAFVRQDALRPDAASGGMKGAVENLLTSADESVDLRKASSRLDSLRRELSGRGGGAIAALEEKLNELRKKREAAAAKNAETLSLYESLEDISHRIGELENDRTRIAGIFDVLEKLTVKRRIDAADECERELKKIRAALASMEDEASADQTGFEDMLNEAERQIHAYEEERIAFRERFPGERDIPEKLRPYPFSSLEEGDPASNEEGSPIPSDGPIPASAWRKAEENPVEPYEDTGALAMEGELVTDGEADNLPDPHEAIASARKLSKRARRCFFLGILFAVLALCGLGVSFLLMGTDIPPMPALVATLGLMSLSLIFVIVHTLTTSRLNELLAEWNAESADEIEIAVQEHLLSSERKNAGDKERRRMAASLESARVRHDDAVAKIREIALRAGISPGENNYETLRLLRERNHAKSAERRTLSERRSKLEGRLGALREQLADVNVSEAELAAFEAAGSVWGREAASLDQARIKELIRERDFTDSALHSAELRRAALAEKLAQAEKSPYTPDEFDTVIASLEEELRELKDRREAVELAADALKKGGETLREGIIPRVTASAARRVLDVTGHWDKVLLDERLSCSLGDNQEVIGNELLSRGTADLAWLSLRLALTEELYRDEKPPVVFDECFAHMDADRCARFLATLTKLEQALVFTCRSDEADAGRELGYPVLEMDNGGQS